jgi:hypothetical protein
MPKSNKNWTAKSTQWAVWFKETADQQVSWRGDRPRELRWKSIVGAAAFTFALGWLGLQLLTSNFHSSGTPIAIVPNKSDQILITPLPSSTAGEVVEIVAATSFDPLGDESENDDLIKFAFDSDPTTAWSTVTYRNQDLGKAGVGLLFDLGISQSISQVEITFISAGQSFSVYVTNEIDPLRNSTELLGAAENSEISTVVSANTPINGQYVLVWLTSLPEVADGFSGGIVDVQIRL